MQRWFREALYGTLIAALLLALFLIWLWRPEHQVRRHTDNLLSVLADKNWTRFAAFIAEDYQDQWGNNRALVLARTREVFTYLRNVQFTTVAPNVRIEEGNAYWQSRILISGSDNELMAAIKERINPLTVPFELEWRHMSAKPWDWQLVRVRNEELTIPAEL